MTPPAIEQIVTGADDKLFMALLRMQEENRKLRLWLTCVVVLLCCVLVTWHHGGFGGTWRLPRVLS